MNTNVITLQDIPRLRPGQEIGQAERQLSAMDQERLSLGQKAASLLGYRVLKSEVTGSIVVPLEDIGELGKALLSLDVEILDAATVIRYQQQEAMRHTIEKANELLRRGQFAYYAAAMWGFTPARWDATEIAKYAEPIPEFVISKAVQIKEAVPKVEFFVQHLNEPKADPFLVAKLNTEVYYVEVWAEPRFEGRVSK